ncbi:hypothetical protein LOZ61_005930 [Ophidiomyces ophidiicola]|nr:hypothetical protein LOZ61_005930 [Ophidiomyces ophidiicola]KAI2028871.1 hypothetical protein LOZ48_003987 [Ophidiomyces ophidiicola]KAI2064270.1 hypothetical protein LOZ40_004797 [Ophidiomyces ophidiicola]KAI2151793.1 hypothetical protein LOZ25_006091 [Ophidiomyces ophidiicola]KAI2234160.1 hypothetical protein LOZ13_005334 [Ophidiomyces ophidiicola]
MHSVISKKYTRAMARPSSCPPSRLLVGLPKKTPYLRFMNMRRLEEDVVAQSRKSGSDPRESPFLVVFDVPPSMSELLENSPSDFQKHHTVLDKREQILVIETMVSNPHETAAVEFGNQLYSKVRSMGLKPLSTGCSTVEEGNYRKEPDGSWWPEKKHRAEMSHQWPNVVLEVGYAERDAKLAIDAQGWLEAAGSTVQIAITVKIDRTTPQIHIKAWEPSYIGRRTRSNHPKAMVKQDIWVTQANGASTASGALELDFEKIFDRPRNPAKPQEQNVIFSKEDLVDLAEDVWFFQNMVEA